MSFLMGSNIMPEELLIIDYSCLLRLREASAKQGRQARIVKTTNFVLNGFDCIN